MHHSALREITGKRPRWRRVQVLRSHGRTHARTARTFEVFLECQHVVEVPFGRRPQVGRKMTCPECALAQRDALPS